MWTLGFFPSPVRNTGPVDGNFAQLPYCFFTFARLACYTSVLLPSLRAAISLFLFCAETPVIRAHPRKQKTNKKNEQGLSSPRSIHVPNPCNTFCLQCQMLVASHTHWGEKKGGFTRKTGGAEQVLTEEEKVSVRVHSSCSTALAAPSQAY